LILTGVQSSKAEILTLMDLDMVMGQHYRQLNSAKGQNQSNREVGNVLLGAFQGTFFFFGMSGHRKNEFPARDNNKSKFKKGCKQRKNVKRCINCRKDGHIAINCCYRKANKDKKPPGFKPLGIKN
jgi:hypothetical protein